MIAVSSLKPFSQCHSEIAANQLNAKASWDKAFERVVYFNDPQPEVDGDNTEFVPTKEPPQIKTMVQRCAEYPGWSCLINADIIIGGRFGMVQQQLRENEALCAISQRYEIPANGDMSQAHTVDLGLDFFAAKQSVWGAVALEIPEEFVIGKILWDYWLNNYLCEMFGHSCYDITAACAVFHPKHEHRDNQRLHMEPDRYMLHNRWPRHAIGFASTVKPL